MTLDDAPAATRRERRMRAGHVDVPQGAGGRAGDDVDSRDVDTRAIDTLAPDLPEPDLPEPDEPVPAASDSPDEPAASEQSPDQPGPAASDGSVTTVVEPETPQRAAALAWLDDDAVTPVPAPGDLTAAGSPYAAVGADLLADAPHRSPWRASVLVPSGLIVLVFALYAATTLLWPLHAVAPTVTAMSVQAAAAAPAEISWPAEGSAAVSVAGIDGAPASTADPDSIASITKVVTALVVLDEMPLAVGEDGPSFAFTYGDMLDYWQYRYRGESALDVPVDGSLTEYQMLEGLLIGSANNYADRLARELYPSDEVFASAAMDWLDQHGVPGITVVEPTGMDAANQATPEALITLAQKAMANPVIAEIVAKTSVTLPGAGLVENTNGLLADDGVVGIKTGTLDRWNVLSAKDVMVGETPVRLYAAVLGQPDDDARLAASRSLYSQVEEQLTPFPSVPVGTVAGQVTTLWGSDSDIVTSADATVVLWNGGTGTVSPTYDLGESRDAGDTVGSITVRGPLDSATADLRLAADIEPPSAWWRITHPLQLWGLTD